MPFPTSFPVSAIPTLITYLRQGGVGRRAAAEAAYDLLGYGLNVTLPADAQNVEALHLAPDLSLAARLEEYQDKLDGKPHAFTELPPWLVPVLLELLRRFMS